MKNLEIKLITLVIMALYLCACAEGVPDTSGAVAFNSADGSGQTPAAGFPPQNPFTLNTSKWKCTYRLTGQKGAAWFSERYVANQQECQSTEMEVVRIGNPYATITKVESNFVHDPVTGTAKQKCTYRLKGVYGAVWFSERYIEHGMSCYGPELDTVRLNNPNAAVVMIKTTNVYDASTYSSKYKCAFNLTGANGNKWPVEVYIDDSDCGQARTIVAQNNPNAQISAHVQNFVFDPF